MSQQGNEVIQEHQQYVLQPWTKQGGPVLPVKRAEGIYFWDYDDKRYTDMSSFYMSVTKTGTFLNREDSCFFVQ